MKVDGCAPSKRLTDQPTESDTEETAEEAHGAGFGKEKTADVAVGSTKSFQDADLAAALEDGHDQRVDDAERSDSKRETAEEAEEKIEDREDQPEAFGGIQQRKGSEAELLDGRFDLRHVFRRVNADGQCHVGRLGGIAGHEGLQIVGLRNVKLLGGLERQVKAGAAETAWRAVRVPRSARSNPYPQERAADP